MSCVSDIDFSLMCSMNQHEGIASFAQLFWGSTQTMALALKGAPQHVTQVTQNLDPSTDFQHQVDRVHGI